MMNCWRIMALVFVALSLGACATSPQNQSGADRKASLQEVQAMHATAQAAYNRDDLRLAQSTYEKIV
jgi:starvation-inducible outer membrane lipoprotein